MCPGCGWKGGRFDARLTEEGLYWERQGCDESGTLVLVPERVLEGSAWAGWHRVHQQGNAVSASEQMTLSVWGFSVCVCQTLFFSVLLLNHADVIHQFPACPRLSVWHERTNLTSFVSLNTSHWLSLTLVLYCLVCWTGLISHVTLYGARTLNSRGMQRWASRLLVPV